MGVIFTDILKNICFIMYNSLLIKKNINKEGVFVINDKIKIIFDSINLYKRKENNYKSIRVYRSKLLYRKFKI